MREKGKKTKHKFFSILQLRILFVVFIASLVLQLSSALIAYFLVSADLIAKRNDDMIETLSALSYNLSSDTLGQGETESNNPNRERVRFLATTAAMVHNEMKSTYGVEMISNLTLGTEEMSNYLTEFETRFRARSGMGMSRDGTPSTISSPCLPRPTANTSI